MISPSVDPYQRATKRVDQLMRYARNPFGAAHMSRSLDQPHKLTEDERKGWLKTIGEETLGSMARVANVIDLPGSSVRDLLAGENPFDQWWPSNWTQNVNRTTGRDLGRKWGLMSSRDTWGNLAGGIGLEMLFDPLIPLGLGRSALGTGGRIAEAAGLMGSKHLALSTANEALEKAALLAGKGAVKTPRLMGMREWMRRGTLQDLLQHSGPPGAAGDLQRSLAMGRLEELAAKAGYKGGAAEILERFGSEPLQGIARWGLPDWKIFGARISDQMRRAPGVMLGKPGSEGSLKWARFFDRTLGGLEGGLGATAPFTHARSLLQKSAGGMVDNERQRLAKAAWEQGKTLASMGRREAGTFDQMLKDALNEADNIDLRKMSLEEKVKVNQHWRELQEMVTKKPELEEFVVHAHNAINQARKYMLDNGAIADDIDDLFGKQVAYFPRQMTAFLSDNGLDQLKAMNPRNPLSGTPTDASFIHNVGRDPLFKDTTVGSKATNEVWMDKKLHEILDKAVSEEAAIKEGADYIRKTYGKKGKGYYTLGKEGELYRGYAFSDLSEVVDKELAAEYKRRHVDIVKKSEEIWKKLGWTDAQKEAAQAQLLAREMVSAGGRHTGPLKMTDSLWELRNTRFEDLARAVKVSSKEARKLGLFSNNPAYDLENYIGRAMDSGNAGSLTIGILSKEKYMARGGSEELRLANVLHRLKMDVPKSLQLIAERRGYGTLNEDQLRALGNHFVDPKVHKDLEQINHVFKGPEAAGWAGRVMDSFMNTFKANVTSPFPAFHVRNLLSGQIRNMLAGTWSWKSFKDAGKLLHGGEVEGLEKLPALQLRYKQIVETYPHLVQQGKIPGQLNNHMANQLARYMAREHALTGRYGTQGVLDVFNQTDPTTGEPWHIQRTIEGTEEGYRAGLVGGVPMDWKHAMRAYFGLPQKINGEWVRTTTMGGPWLGFPTLDLPTWIGRKIIGKTGLKMGRKTPRMEHWAAEKFFAMPSVAKVRGVTENMGLSSKVDQVGPFVRDAARKETTTRNLMWGPAEGGQEVGHAVEAMNRVAPWLYQLYEGVDPIQAARQVSAAQISYAAKDYTSFEQQKMKRIVPFYSFTSRSLPWSLNKFFEQPGNMLAQIMRTAKRTGEHLRGTIQEPGVIPSYIGETLAWPIPAREPGVQRFFTGFDLMDQDMWQLLGPALAGRPGEVGQELMSRVAPLPWKFGMETAFGVSTHQRGIEGGRPLRNMDPPMGRAAMNVYQTMANMMGEKLPESQLQSLEKFGTLENLVANSPYSRYLGTVRQAFDPRKNLLDKAVNLLTGAKIQDISPRQQETNLREAVKSLISEEGGRVFELASFSKPQLEWWKRTDPQRYKEARELMALQAERVRVSKAMAKAAQAGLPVGR